MDDIIKKNITIAEATPNTTAAGKVNIKIKDERNLTYRIWKLKQDGTNTKAYDALTELEDNGLGKTIAVGFSEQKGEFQGKEVTYRTVIMVAPEDPSIVEQTGSNFASNAPNSQNTPNYPNAGNVSPGGSQSSVEGVDWDKVSWGKCKHAYLVEAFKTYKSDGAITKDMIETEAEKWADMSMRDSREVKTNETPPVPSGEETIDVSKIPF